MKKIRHCIQAETVCNIVSFALAADIVARVFSFAIRTLTANQFLAHVGFAAAGIVAAQILWDTFAGYEEMEYARLLGEDDEL